ncbi:MAG: sensor domain-containing protein [Propionibacteriaceae bacterium]|nr:sensor domain-containing protein [Propionibacteriaceae bacterium]
MSMTPTLTSHDLPTRLPLGTRWKRALAVQGASFILSIIFFAITISFFFTGVGTAIIWIGLPILAATLLFAHTYGRLKKKFALWQGASNWDDLPPAPRGKGAWGWMWAALRSPERWRELAYATIGALFDFILAVVAVAVVGFGIGEIIGPFMPWSYSLLEGLTLGGIEISVAEAGASPGNGPLGPLLPTMAARALDFLIGVVTLVISPFVVWACSAAQIGLTRLFLAPSRRAIANRLSKVEQAHQAATSAESSNLSRIERDLHDGPQQRLIRTGLDLATLERRLDSGDTEGARALLSEVRGRNDETIAEIRTLSRGFAPPILADHGLKQAIASLAATCPIPCSVSTDLSGSRPPEAIERAIYFSISESLTNAAKYSAASAVTITVNQNGYGIIAEVRDNGRGGAAVVAGHGLVGLADRLASVGGAVAIASPVGGGTSVRVEVPFR